MKKNILGVMLIIGFVQQSMSQQIPLYSQYYLNPFVYNPARTGDRGNLHANLTYRTQWVDIKGAPETYAATLDGSIKEQKAGFGGFVYADNISFFRRFGGYFSYAYHIRIKEEHTISLGLAAGVMQTTIDQNKAYTDQPNDPVLATLNRGVGFDASAGINYRYKGLNVGFSIPQLFQTKLSYLNNKDIPLNYQLSRHYLIHTSYNINIKEGQFFIEPLAFFRISGGRQFQVDVGAKFQYKNLAWIGLMYRSGYAFTPGAGFNVHDRITLGYAYDFAVNDLRTRAGGTHEAFIGIKFGRSEDKGIIETLKQIQQRQDLMDQKIDRVVSENDSLRGTNEQLRKTLEEKEREISNLRSELEKKLKEFQEEMARQTPPVKVDVPRNAIYEGKKEDLDFLDGDPGTGYFMVVAATKTERGARQEQQTFKAKGYDVGIVLNKRRSWYYLYLSKPGNFEDGIKELYKLRQKSEFKDAWIHIYK